MEKISLEHIYVGKEFGLYYFVVFVTQNFIVKQQLEHRELVPLASFLEHIGFSSEIKDFYIKEELDGIINAANDKIRYLYDSSLLEQGIAYAREFWLGDANPKCIKFFEDRVRFCLYQQGYCILEQGKSSGGILEEIQKRFPEEAFVYTRSGSMILRPTQVEIVKQDLKTDTHAKAKYHSKK